MLKNNKKDKKEEEQLELGLKESPVNLFYKIKEKLYYQFKILEMKKFFRDPLIWLFTSLTITTTIYQSYLLDKYLEKLPTKVPLMQMYISLDKKIISKNLLWIIPGLSVGSLLISLFTSNKHYSNNQTLSVLSIFYVNITSLILTYSLVKALAFYIY